MPPKLPQIKGERLLAVFSKLGWYIDRRSGSHVIMRNENKKQIRLVIPIHGKSIKPGTLSNILKQAQVSVEELKELL